MPNWVQELKRRNVFRVALAYLVGAWLILQVADVVLDNIGAPGWVMQALMLLLAIGFPVTLTFSWLYELTPEGLRRESEIDPAASITPRTGQRLDRLIVGLLLLVLVAVGARWAVDDPSGAGDDVAAGDSPAPGSDAAAPPVPGEASRAAAVSEKSIAVLAFKDLSPEGDQAYFAEGISEELLNVLAQVPGLKVAGRTSSFAFKDQTRDLREIGEILEVANILEGSVRTDGNRVRVTAQLIKANDGFHLFSRNYDRELTDIFKVQDDIAKEIAVVLKATILGDSPVENVAATDPHAYENYLKARQWIHTRDHDLMEEALRVLDEALAIDPAYAPALAQKAMALVLLSDSGSSYGDIPVEQALAESRPLIDRALALDPHSAEALAVSGLWYGTRDLESSEPAIADLRRALQINPSLTNAINWLAIELPTDTGRAEAIALYEMAMEHDPLYRPAFNNLVVAYLETRQFDAAEALIRRVERVAGESPLVQLAFGMLDFAQGELASAYPSLERAWDYNPRASVARGQYGNALLFLGEYERAAEVLPRADGLMALWLLSPDQAAEVDMALLDLRTNDFESRAVSDWLLVQGRAAELVALMASSFGGDAEWVANLPTPLEMWGVPVATNAALALLETGDETEAKAALRFARRTLDTQRALGADNLAYWANEAEYAALTGDRKAMLENLARAVDAGFVSMPGFWQPAFDAYRKDPQFVAVERRSIERAKAERAKLGLPTLVPNSTA